MDSEQHDNFEGLIRDALQQDFSGWDFSWLDGRWREDAPPWDYRAMVARRLTAVDALLDMGTGGGEFLSSLSPLPPQTHATEAYAPNVPVAQARLAPLGVTVAAIDDDRRLPFPDRAFDLIINRHEAFWSTELHRILKPGGIFITQQVGALNCVQLNEFLCDEVELSYGTWTLSKAIYWLQQAGFEIIASGEAFPDCAFYDIGAVVFYLKVIEWQIPGFTVSAYREKLLRLHERILKEGAFVARDHRFFVEARKPI